MQLPVFNMQGEQVGTHEIPDEWLKEKVNTALLHQVVVAHLANARQGTHSTKRRGEVRGGGRKPWRQKGTGRARQGSIRAPQWRGGGVVHGPKPLDWDQKVNKKMKQAALKQAWISKIRDGEVMLLDKVEMEQPKTKMIFNLLKALGISERKVLLLMDGRNLNVELSCRNLPNVLMLPAHQPSVYDLLNAHRILMPLSAMKVVEGRLAS